MPIEQNGTDATVDIRGDSNDVGGDQINLNLVVNGLIVAPSDRSSASEQARRQEDPENTLKDTIQDIQGIAKLVSLDLAKDILAGITAILSLLPNGIRNHDSLDALIRSCEAIGSTLALATKDVSVGQMSETLANALTELKLSVHNFHSKVEEALQYGISEWAADLDAISTTFSGRLNMVPGVPLGQVPEFLTRSDDHHRLIPDPPPPDPAVFFGRDELMDDIKHALLREQNVALIGTVGIGKSLLAKAVINDKDIKKRYVRRFFIRYDDLDRTSMTFDVFTQRIANILGLPASGAESERHVRSNLESSPVLLVLDNAETFEEAVDQFEKTRISSFVSDIALTSGVTVILTSRTRNNARGIRWTCFDVPQLDKVSARQYFRFIYSGEMQEADIDMLLVALDFHPLSIHILAYTAEENLWTGSRLLHEWQVQQSRLLQTGYGKENLGFTISLSLNSHSVQAFGADSLNVLGIIAFFPRGINEDHAESLFPSIPNILSITDMLRRVSLIYRSGSFLTMLAPIRLFLRDAFPTAGLALLQDIRQTYYDSLEALTAERDFHAGLVVSDHLNIERLIAFDIDHRQGDIQYARATRACCKFFYGLADHKPRPTLLASIISSLPEASQTEKNSKAWCLESLGHLNAALSCYSYAGKALLDARTLFFSVGNHDIAARCTCNAARSYNDRGYFSHARQLVDDFIQSSSWQYIDEERKAEIYFALDESRMNMSSLDADTLFLCSTEHRTHGLGSHILHWRTRMLHGYTKLEEVQAHLEPFRFDCMSSPNAWDRWYFLGALAELEFLQHRYNAAMQLLSQAHDSFKGMSHLTLVVLRDKAAVASAQGDYNLARYILQIDTLGRFAAPSSVHILAMRYFQGRNELYAGHVTAAHHLLADVVVHCDACDEIGTKTLCTRALGEVALLLGRRTESDAYFSQTVQLCREGGVPPRLLGICKPMMTLDDYRFPGWWIFLREHPD